MSISAKKMHCASILYYALILIYRAVADTCEPCQCCAYSNCYYASINGTHYDRFCHNGCISGYWSPGCTKRCIENCKTCDRFEGCTECYDGYYLVNGKCQECQYKRFGCTCSNENLCTGCLSGFFFADYRCDKCPINCSECTSYNECTKCIAGQYGNQCSGMCKYRNCYCSFQNGCNSCRDGFYSPYYDCTYNCNANCNSCQINAYDCTTCKSGFYGLYCTDRCEQGCANNKCDKVTGTCICQPNYSGSKCNVCVPGKYGPTCQLDCSIGCLPNQCARNNGQCECRENFAGFACNSCANGYHGTQCNISCSPGCMYNLCNRLNGQCTDKCNEGYSGIYCCLNGTFGYYCHQKCPQGCLTCSSLRECQVCKDGFYGTSCDKSCPTNCKTCTSLSDCSQCQDRFFGPFCNNTCSQNCKTCDSSGRCILCKDGFLYPEKQCQCVSCSSDACTSCLNTTNYTNGRGCCPCNTSCKNAVCSSAGQCTLGCEDGYFGLGCDRQCSDENMMCSICSDGDMHGFKCQSCINGQFPDINGKCTPCSSKCVNNECNSSNGICKGGCQAGYWNLKCDNLCKANCSACDQRSGDCLVCSTPSLYGIECNMACSNTCINASCHMNGTCTSGCIADYSGPSCDTPCPQSCARKGNQSRCYPVTGLCVFGCSAGFTGKDCMEALQLNNSKDTPAAAIGGGIAAVVIIGLVVIMGIIIFMRRRNRKPKKEPIQEVSTSFENSSAPVYACVKRDAHTGSVYENTSSVKANNSTVQVHNPVYTNSIVEQDSRLGNNIVTEDGLEIDEWDRIGRLNAILFEENGGVYYNNDEKLKQMKIPVTELQAFVMSKHMDFFKSEFEKIPYGLLKEYRVSQMKPNIGKNRYKGIYPYDDHRVKVRGGDTDYINASFIDGFQRQNEYIATLGPMSKQLVDFAAFWRMVWQQNVEKIVMVTNLVEEGKDKCEKYWPSVGATQLYGDIQVFCQSDEKYAEFTRRAFDIIKDRQTRTLTQLHFTSWPDKDVPEDVTSIIEFRQNVLRAPATLGGPTIVHCSAGVGRTGTYIAIDILTKEGEAEGAVDIPGCVLNMRQNRPNMVQTAGQYAYLHHAVVHSLTFDCKPVACEKFQLYMDTTSKDKIRNIFHQLQETASCGSSDETEAVTRNAKRTDKNREAADVPGDEHRPKLYLNRKPGSTDYINAVLMNSFQKNNKYILAQTPLPNTVGDFVALLVQTNCACIVNLESANINAVDIGVYLPADNQVLKNGIFSVRCSKPETNEYRNKRTMTIENRANQAIESLSLTYLEFTDWNTEERIPNYPSEFRRFIAEVDAVTANNSDRPVLIHCLDGASKCGLFCVVANLLQKMEVEHEVSVANAVRKVRTRRKGAIPNLEQFQFCHDCVLDYIQSSNIYYTVAAELSDC